MKKLATLAAASLLLGLAACGDDKPDPIPSSSSTPTASAAPSAPALDDDQKADYEAALSVYEQYNDIVTGLSSEPNDVSKDDLRELVGVSTKTNAKALLDELQEVIDAGARTTGQTATAWMVPVEVTSDRVTLSDCQTPGDWELVGKDGKTAPQIGNTLTKVSLTLINDRWYVHEVEGDGEC